MKVRRKRAADADFFQQQPAFADQYSATLRSLANKGVWFGTSSWFYPGWRGLVYPTSVSSESMLRKIAFQEYCRVFPTGCADWSFYSFPSTTQIAKYAREAPADFRLAFKATDLVTIYRYPYLKDRWGDKAGKVNEDFLNAKKFKDFFLKPVEALGGRLGPIIFEFSPLTWNGLKPDDFLKQLDRFLGAMPSGFTFAVEIRNRELLKEQYFDLLRKRGVAHVVNSWTRMPSMSEQWRELDVRTADCTVVRALLKPGRTYQEAVKKFEPYTNTKEINAEAREALVDVARHALKKKKPAFIYVNNRLEGNAPKTIAAVIDELERG